MILLDVNEDWVWGDDITSAAKPRPQSSHTQRGIKPVIIAVTSTAHPRMTLSIAPGAGKAPRLKFSRDKTSFVWSLFGRPSLRQKSIPHDAFIVFSQTHTRAHICRHGYCTTIAAPQSSRRSQCNYDMNVTEGCVMNWCKENSCQHVKLPTQFSGFGCFYSIVYCRLMIQINN